jgi:hypothetical protein
MDRVLAVRICTQAAHLTGKMARKHVRESTRVFSGQVGVLDHDNTAPLSTPSIQLHANFKQTIAEVTLSPRRGLPELEEKSQKLCSAR